MNFMKGKIVSNIHNDAIKELLFESAMTTLLKQGKPDNEATELEAVDILDRDWETINVSNT